MNDALVPDIAPSLPEAQPPIPQPLVELHGWGRTSGTVSHLATIDSVADAVSALRTSGPQRGVVPRGLGRSYGDAAQNAGGMTLDLTKLNRILAVDAQATTTVTVQAGVSLDAADARAAPVRPVGAGAAGDPPGHHRRGDRGGRARQEPPHRGQLRQPRPSLDLLMADGEVRTLTPHGDTERTFWATIGGMGLTGAVLAATVALQRTETAYFVVDTDRCTDLDDLMTRMSDGDDAYTYSVAWFDAVTRGKHLGRAVLTRGNKARLADLTPKQRRDPLKFVAPQLGTIPEVFPNRMVNKATAKAFSEFWFRKAPKHGVGQLQNITQFFHPLDIVAEWNRIYGPHGFLQYQFVVPFDADDTLPPLRAD